jgi:hypothetical protein
MNPDIQTYHREPSEEEEKITFLPATTLNQSLPEAEHKIWYRHPVWFLQGNPIAGYSKQKAVIRLMSWSGADFEEADLKPGSGKFKDASIFYTHVDQVNIKDLVSWIEKSKTIQRDYKNIVRRKGKLERLK